ncbi:hypothetical protein N7373_13475 [Achromobacter mucicolens]|uniref:hypothetical protein n=1 Tax=Achromobacter mucicolens TaxID=1389922 RepID=UPI00244A8189|nr:hypothetical protein [Achromobacter mucicolens]MDH0092456.1 hypothetical protein [Achromobacter mucicolens]
MSDSPIYIVDLDVTLEAAPAFANIGMNWMEAMGIAVRAPGAEVAFSPVSHAPGPGIAQWAKWVNAQSENGIGAIVGRRVYNAGPQAVEALRCPCCAAEHDAAAIPWQEMISAWYSGERGELECPSCRQSESINQWRFLPLAWGLGNLAFGFDGPGIDDALALELGKVLGHRMAVVFDKF